MAVLMWIGFAIASLLMNYPTHIKMIRDLTTDENQGKIFGMNETCIGIFNIVFTQISTAAAGFSQAAHGGIHRRASFGSGKPDHERIDKEKE